MVESVLLVGVGVSLIVVVLVRAWVSRARAARGRDGRRVGREDLGVPPGVGIRYTLHARERMAQRGVTRAQVEDVLATPDRRHHNEVEGSFRLEKAFDQGILKVWVAAEPWPPVGQVDVRTTAWKFVETFEIPAETVGVVKGRQGARVRCIEAETGAKVTVSSDGAVRILAGERHQVADARRRVEELVASRPPQVGERVVGTVVKIADHGAFVAMPHGRDGYLPVANLRALADGRHIDDINDVVGLNQRLEVEVEAYRDGRPRLAPVS